jgi:MoaA/NifB/PqqE/SkfB family radical SAM enzyme
MMSFSPPYSRKNITFSEYPTFLEIDLPNSHCNINPPCVMCERASPLFKPDEDRLMEVLPRLTYLMPNLSQIHIQGIAEPFWKDIIFKILDVIDFDRHKENITISTTTNGTLLSQKRRKHYLERIPHSITNFSLDAASPETYKGIRTLGGKVFEKVLSNLYDFAAERVQKRQFLRVSNNINMMNIHEVIGMVHIAKKANAEFVEFNATDGFNHLILANMKNCLKFAKAQEDIVTECEKIALPYSFVRPLDMGLSHQLMKTIF